MQTTLTSVLLLATMGALAQPPLINPNAPLPPAAQQGNQEAAVIPPADAHNLPADPSSKPPFQVGVPRPTEPGSQAAVIPPAVAGGHPTNPVVAAAGPPNPIAAARPPPAGGAFSTTEPRSSSSQEESELSELSEEVVESSMSGMDSDEEPEISNISEVSEEWPSHWDSSLSSEIIDMSSHSGTQSLVLNALVGSVLLVHLF